MADDADAIAGFRDAHLDQITAYCETACPADLVAEARDAAFVDFLGRIRLSEGEVDLDALLLKATRGAAAGRFDVVAADAAGGRGGHAPEQVCLAMPELLAAYLNGELDSDERGARRHLDGCATCAATIERLNRAEARFAGVGGWDEPAAEAEAEPEPETAPDPEPEPEAVQEPAPAPPVPPPPPTPQVVRVRRGGLVGATRRLVGRPREGDRRPGP